MTESEEQAGPARLSLLRRKPWIVVTILFAICLLPLIAAWVLYLNINNVHLGTTQHGEFIRPARALHMAALPLPMAGGSLAPDYFQGKFTLVYISGAFCNPDCEEALILTRQTRLALGRKIEAVQRLYLVLGDPDNPAKLLRDHPDMTTADAAGPVGARFIRQFSLNGQQAPDIGKYIYLVDPRGLYIMRYSISGPPEGMLEDLEHLLGMGGGM